MNRVLKPLSVMSLILLLAISLPASEPTSTAEGETSGTRSIMSDRPQTISEEIETLLIAREAALSDILARYKSALPTERTAIELEGAAINEDYERAYLELIAEYHRLAGNETELAKAEAQLEVINAGVPTGTPMTLDRNRTVGDGNEGEEAGSDE